MVEVVIDKLDEGLQYCVYDLGDEVRKEPKSRSEMISYLKKFGDSVENVEEGVDDAIQRREKIELELKGSDLPLIADFEIRGGVIVQEKLGVTGDLLNEIDNLKQKKKIIDDYIELVKECWKYGFHDMSYNFTLNTGVDENGNILQLDLGDLIFSKERIRNEIGNQKWLNESASYKKYLKQDIKPYYRRKMREEITPQNFDKLWEEKTK